MYLERFVIKKYRLFIIEKIASKKIVIDIYLFQYFLPPLTAGQESIKSFKIDLLNVIAIEQLEGRI